MNLYFWQHLGVIGWAGFALCCAGFTLAWTRWLQVSMACSAFGATALGLSLLLDRADLPHLTGALVLFLLAFIVIVVAAVKERNDSHGKWSKRQGQDHGVLPEGSEDHA